MALFAPGRTREQRFSHSGQSEANLHHYGGIHLWLSRLFAGAPLVETNFHLHSAHTACEIQLDSGSNFYTSPDLFNVGVHLCSKPSKLIFSRLSWDFESIFYIRR